MSNEIGNTVFDTIMDIPNIINLLSLYEILHGKEKKDEIFRRFVNYFW